MNTHILNNWGTSIIDSRDIISRYEELTIDMETYMEHLTEAELELANFPTVVTPESDDYGDYIEVLGGVSKASEELHNYTEEYREELELLKDVISQGESSPDWSYGECLIHESYFTEYTKDLVEECWEFPKEVMSNKWPWSHMSMDWDSAAEEAKQDYYTIEANGETYYIRR